MAPGVWSLVLWPEVDAVEDCWLLFCWPKVESVVDAPVVPVLLAEPVALSEPDAEPVAADEPLTPPE